MSTSLKMVPVDLHCHSNYSDGGYPVEALLDLVKSNAGLHIALTDHDTVSGIQVAKEYASTIGLNLLSGVEISVTWNATTIHIIGLGVNETDITLNNNLEQLRQGRIERGHRIAAGLARVGIADAFAGAMKYCTNPNALSRTHFFKFLVNSGYANSRQAFDKYLIKGRAGYVAVQWTTLENAVKWIVESGGIAIIAHPLRYKFTRTKLVKLIMQFKYYGGQGIEVMNSHDIIALAKQYKLLASVGNDFHDDSTNYHNAKVGLTQQLSTDCDNVFSLLNIKL
jgi:predicted metal-dependent phosphoesterase TrpH